MVYLLGEVKGSRRVVRKIVQVPSVGDLTSVVDLPSALFELHTAAQDGWELLGVAHSHSEWFPVPSRRDRTTQARLELY
jgi:proteasome lid subunit RPN8/RPN11